MNFEVHHCVQNLPFPYRYRLFLASIFFVYNDIFLLVAFLYLTNARKLFSVGLAYLKCRWTFFISKKSIISTSKNLATTAAFLNVYTWLLEQKHNVIFRNLFSSLFLKSFNIWVLVVVHPRMVLRLVAHYVYNSKR